MIEHGQFVENCKENDWSFEIAVEQAAKVGYRIWTMGQRSNGRWWVSMYLKPGAKKHANDKSDSNMTATYEAESPELAICHAMDRMMFHTTNRHAGMDPHGTGNNKWPDPMPSEEWARLAAVFPGVPVESLYAFHTVLVRLTKAMKG